MPGSAPKSIGLLVTAAILTSCATSSERGDSSHSRLFFGKKTPSLAPRPKADSSNLEGYEKQVVRIIKTKWDQNCLLMRDYVVPGLITARFSVDADGRVGNISLVSSDAPEIEKKFTLDAIQNAVLPAMPEQFRSKYIDKQLDVIFNFYF